MKVLALTRYDRLGASSRMRMLQYLPWLTSAGVTVTVSPLFPDAYVQDLQKGQRSPWLVLRAYWQRLLALLGSGNFDLLWIEKECLPWLPTWIERALLPARTPYVLDYDDAVFHYYDEHRSRWVRRLLGGKHPALMRNAALVVAGNAYLSKFANSTGAPRVEIIPTTVDLTRYPAQIDKALVANTPCVGWIGQSATANFLQPLAPLFERLSVSGLARFAAIGINAQELSLPMASIPWTEASEVASIQTFDIGIMPLLDGPFERGKCGYKLIQYMACGLPVIASPVGVNAQIVDHGVNGFLASSLQEWEDALTTLLTDSGVRERMGRAGRHKVEQEYCLQVTGPRLANLLQSAAGQKTKYQ